MLKSSYCEFDYEILFYYLVFFDKVRNVNYYIDL